ncbi:hypothetical protein [Arthrobacter luteolus]|uniref:hypothetical protein n=1 Tax=Arthrobacter luteolus TaxID=98672 RepID=UPI00384A5A61
MLKDVSFSGLNFTSTGRSFRQIVGRACANLTFTQCSWSAGDLPGMHVKLTDSLNTLFTRCKATRHAREVGSGSSWNSFMVGGGCHKATFDNCDFVGEMQTIDFTPNLFDTSADPGFNSLTSASTIQYMKITNCTFTACNDAGTSHPGSHYFEYLNNRIIGGSTGVRARSRTNIIKGNTIYTSRAGVALSAFCSNTTVEGNECVQIPSSAGILDSFYTGISYSGVSSEINNGNFVENLTINGNRVVVNTYNVNTSGILLTNNTPTFTDAQKVTLSFIVVSNNWIKITSIIASNWVHGTKFFGNHFAGNTNREAALWCQDNTGRNLILENTFDTAQPTAIAVKTGTCAPPAGAPYPFNTVNRVSPQVGVYQTPNFALTNWTHTVTAAPA